MNMSPDSHPDTRNEERTCVKIARQELLVGQPVSHLSSGAEP
jgi:hypothetical protein